MPHYKDKDNWDQKHEKADHSGDCYCGRCNGTVTCETKTCPSCGVYLWEVLINDYDDVLLNARQFEKDLNNDTEICEQLYRFKHWYYFDETGSFAPSKYIGYKNMDANRYDRGKNKNGGATEAELSRWFRQCKEETEGRDLAVKLSTMVMNAGGKLRSNFVIHVRRAADDPQSILNDAVAKMEREQWGEAINILTQYVQMRPKDWRGYYHRGISLLNSGDASGAVNDLSWVIGHKPKEADAYERRGGAFFTLGRYENAIKDYDAALLLNPNDLDALSGRANAKIEIEDHRGAVADISLLLQHVPDDANLLVARGDIYNRMDNYSQAYADLTEAINIDKGCTDAYEHRGISLCNLGKYADAEKDLSRAILSKVDDSSVYHNRAIARFELNRFGEALEDMNRAIELDPDNSELFQLRGEIFERLAKLDLAELDFKKAEVLGLARKTTQGDECIS
jgi:Flp pilus assembly protein TadD